MSVSPASTVTVDRPVRVSVDGGRVMVGDDTFDVEAEQALLALSGTQPNRMQDLVFRAHLLSEAGYELSWRLLAEAPDVLVGPGVCPVGGIPDVLVNYLFETASPVARVRLVVSEHCSERLVCRWLTYDEYDHGVEGAESYVQRFSMLGTVEPVSNLFCEQVGEADPRVRWRAVQCLIPNLCLSDHQIRLLLGDVFTAWPVSQAAVAASHPGLGRRSIAGLSRHASWSVRAGIAGRVDAPRWVLARLAYDSDQTVAEKARVTLELVDFD